ncbi:hypothetical protein JKP88DRAFT_216850 [Tribonema minus]|uniref:Uncharacterized protein n=1 Tax=Tribonema minus TaxID=303371 RepID=A0A836CN82_9STRA|nr:hypothetical protein JKP88DRAFT_216850 [Tribonema minus]
MGIMDWLSGAKSQPQAAKFIRLGGSEDAPVVGARCVIAAGLPGGEVTTLRNLLSYETHPVLLLSRHMLDMTLQEALEDCQKLAQEPPVSAADAVELDCPVVLISGYGNTEVTQLIRNYKEVTDMRPAFAKVVPNAMGKNLGRLFGEIGNDHRERQAQQRVQQQQQQQ